MVRKIGPLGALASACAVVGLTAMPDRSGAVGVGKMCDGIAGIPCNRGLFCDHKAGQCRGADISGICVRVPQVCAMVNQLVCGCNGRTYGNDCERRRARVRKKQDGPCRP